MSKVAYFDDFERERNHGTQKEKNQNRTSRSSGTGSSGSSSTVRARARTREEECAAARYAAYQEAVGYYEASFGQRAGISLKTEVREAVLQGCSAAVIIGCIQEAEAAPRPSWGYARAVLRRCMASGILTAEDWAADQQRRASRANPAGAYAQRDYTEEDFRKVFTPLGLDEDE